MKEVGLPLDRPCTLADIPRFERLLNVSILVISGSQQNSFVYPVDKTGVGPRRIYLYHTQTLNGGHFDLVKSLPGLFDATYFCSLCFKPYSSVKYHKCQTFCKVCQNPNCLEEDPRSCRGCLRVCRSSKCFEGHRVVKGKNRLSCCERYKKCLKCKTILDCKELPHQEHECEKYKCSVCKEMVYLDHNCFMRYLDKGPPKSKLYFYDFESQIVGEKHIPLYCVVQSCCKECQNLSIQDHPSCPTCGSRCKNCERTGKEGFINPPCPDTCGLREKTFCGPSTLTDFCKWAIHKNHKDSFFIAHCSSRYDGLFVLSYLVDNAILPQIAFNGRKIVTMKIMKGLNIEFIDSYKFLNMSLSRLAKCFNLQNKEKFLSKTYFPYFFLTEETLEYQGPIPEVEYYNPDCMMAEDRANFLKWHASQKGYRFNMKDELYSYCQNDVELLRLAFLEFKKIVENLVEKESGVVEGFDVLNSSTLPSLCFNIFQYLYMDETWEIEREGEVIETIKKAGRFHLQDETLELDDPRISQKRFLRSQLAMLKPLDVKSMDQYSRKSIVWLKYMERMRGHSIQHALNGGEKILVMEDGRRMRVDGYHEESKTCFEFQGCWYHGCFYFFYPV